jgi:cobalt/nickel transport system ATP-binding protein
VNHRDARIALEADAIRFAYPGGIEALGGLAFRALQGELVAVLGANGSGKTTLMKILMRLLRPQQGVVRLHGVDVAGLSTAELYRQIGMVFQNPADQLFAATVEQDVAFGPRNLGLPETEVRQRVEEALSAVDAGALADRPIQRLSFGQQKRVCLAGVLAMRPSILVLDEPTAGLDPASESQTIELLVRLNRQRNITTIVSTHCVDLLPVLADRIYVLSQGRMQREGPPREILADRQVAVEAGLRLPLIAQLFHDLRESGVEIDTLPLTTEEARRQLLARLGAANGISRPGGPP